jgi:hypothetical protein
MNYSLIHAGSRTHCKIVATAFAISILLGIAAHASWAHTPFKPQSGQTMAQIERSSVCRYSGS